MGAVWLRAAAQLRGRVRSSLLLALMVAYRVRCLAWLAGAAAPTPALPRFWPRAAPPTHGLVKGPRGGRPPEPTARELRAVAASAGPPAERSAPCPVRVRPTGPSEPSRRPAGWARPGRHAIVRPSDRWRDGCRPERPASSGRRGVRLAAPSERARDPLGCTRGRQCGPRGGVPVRLRGHSGRPSSHRLVRPRRPPAGGRGQG